MIKLYAKVVCDKCGQQEVITEESLPICSGYREKLTQTSVIRLLKRNGWLVSSNGLNNNGIMSYNTLCKNCKYIK